MKRSKSAVKTKPSMKRVAKSASVKKAVARKSSPPSAVASKRQRIFTMSFASVYPLYVQKAEKKGRTKQDVDEIVSWLTGYSGAQLQRAIDTKVDFETFFAQAPLMNPNV